MKIITLIPIIMQMAFNHTHLHTDTVLYNAPPYKVHDNPQVEELLKIMEGFEAGADGVVSFHGQPVKRIKINGKERNIDVAKVIKRLPADLVEILEVIDDYGDAANNTFKNSGPKELLNIIIKKSKEVNLSKLGL